MVEEEGVRSIRPEPAELEPALEAVPDGDDGNGDAPLFCADADALAVQEMEVEVVLELAPPPAKLDASPP